MLKPLTFHLPAHRLLALYDWTPFWAMTDHIFVVGKVQRTGLISRIFKTKTVAVDINLVLSIEEMYSIMYKGPILRDSLILQSEKRMETILNIDLIRSIPTK